MHDQHLQVFSGGQREIDASRKRADEAEQALLARTRTLEEVQKVAEVKDLELKVISHAGVFTTVCCPYIDLQSCK